MIRPTNHASRFADKCVEQLGDALKKHGTYQFDDKGADEVMNIWPLVDELKAMHATEAAKFLLELAKRKTYEGRCEILAATLVRSLQNWDELFECPELDEIDW